MREIEKRRGPNKKDEGLPAKSETRDRKLLEKKGGRNFKEKEIRARPSSDKSRGITLVSDIKPGTEASKVSEDMDIQYDDDASMSEDDDTQNLELDDGCNEKINGNSSDMEIVDESDAEDTTDLVSSHGESLSADELKSREVASDPEKLVKNHSSDGHFPMRSKSVREENSPQIEASNSTPTEGAKLEKVASKSVAKSSSDNLRNMKVHPKPQSDFVELADNQPVEKDKVSEILADTDNGAHVMRSDEEAVNTEKISEEDMAAEKKIEDMETRIKYLENELREVAAFEIALYSVTPEHGSSAHKVHTPARRLSRLYIHACKYWSQDQRASIARNTVSGLVLVAKSCSNDVSRLTFWLSNAVVLREFLSQAFGSSCLSSATILESNAVEVKTSPMRRKNINGTGQLNKQSYLQLFDDWQETRTFTAALEKVESWIFSRIVESIWWQTLTPNMQPPVGGTIANRATERLLGPALGDRKQGDFSINLWKNAFHDALKRLCPVRAGEHECGCLPILARKVMEQCIGRLDVAMFNAILRESVHEIPTDPVSDPIVDSKVLPIPAGDLSFGSGAQLKNSVGNWARWLSAFLGMNDDNAPSDGKEDHSGDGDGDGDNDEKRTVGQKTFPLLNALSDLLMLPKDLLLDRTVKMEVCPSISIQLVKRILCNFSPDEFCPDPVPGAVLEALNAECIIDRRLSGDSSSSFPYTASPVLYTPPSSLDVSEKVAEASANSHLSRSTSFMHGKGYTSDEELDELESCLTSVINKSPSYPPTNGSANGEHKGASRSNARYDLLREVWRSAKN